MTEGKEFIPVCNAENNKKVALKPVRVRRRRSRQHVEHATGQAADSSDSTEENSNIPTPASGELKSSYLSFMFRYLQCLSIPAWKRPEY